MHLIIVGKIFIFVGTWRSQNIRTFKMFEFKNSVSSLVDLLGGPMVAFFCHTVRKCVNDRAKLR